MAHILTMEEAVSVLQTDNDFDGRIRNALPAIDNEIYIGTGVRWELEKPVYPLAKSLAEVKLRIKLGASTNPAQDEARERLYMTSLQAEAIYNSRGASYGEK